MASIGHGISDAVRNHIPVWVDEDLVNILYPEYKNSGGVLSKEVFHRRLRQSDQWVRKSRRKSGSGSHERLYSCKTVAKASLIVHSPPADKSANGYVFLIDGSPIAGGKTKLQSTHITTAVSKKDKTTIHPRDVIFVKFSDDELRKMRTQMEFGDGFEHLELEREA